MTSDLNQLEIRIRNRAAIEADSEFESRVLGSVARELDRSQLSEWSNRRWAAVAAAVFLLINFSVISSGHDAFAFHHATSRVGFADELRAIQQIEAQEERMFK